MTSGTPDPGAFRRALRRWYLTHGRHSLPWRHTRNPWAVLVSEFMLQQTQVERVVPYFTAWLARWPDAASLARATPADAIEAWAGLGYNRRALNLHRAALAVSANGMPRTAHDLRQLPGVGRYTADAVACFAYGDAAPVSDTNISRVLARAFHGVASPREVSPPALRVTATSLLPARNARDHNLALMDLGAMVCTARNPDCAACPVAGQCGWRESGYPPSNAPARPAAPRFETTARFARGRIVDFLRGRPQASRDALVSALPPEHHAALDGYLDALLRDGVLETTDGGFRLPR